MKMAERYDIDRAVFLIENYEPLEENPHKRIEDILGQYNLSKNSTNEEVQGAKDLARRNKAAMFRYEDYTGNLHVAVIDMVYRPIFGPRGGFGGENPGFIDGLLALHFDD